MHHGPWLDTPAEAALAQFPEESITIEIDEAMPIFPEACMDHLADIKNDFLSTEEAGTDIDEKMIRNV